MLFLNKSASHCSSYIQCNNISSPGLQPKSGLLVPPSLYNCEMTIMASHLNSLCLCFPVIIGGQQLFNMSKLLQHPPIESTTMCKNFFTSHWPSEHIILQWLTLSWEWSRSPIKFLPVWIVKPQSSSTNLSLTCYLASHF